MKTHLYVIVVTVIFAVSALFDTARDAIAAVACTT